MSTWRGEVDDRVELLDPESLRSVDYERFWHCYEGDATCGFGVVEDGELVALAAVRERGFGLQEIGMMSCRLPEVMAWAGRWWGLLARTFSTRVMWLWRRRLPLTFRQLGPCDQLGWFMPSVKCRRMKVAFPSHPSR